MLRADERVERLIKSSEVSYPCPDCGLADQLRVGQSGFDGRLRWGEYTCCVQCGLTTEASGVGFPPEEIREKMIAVNGQWVVFLDQVKSSAITTKVIMKSLDVESKQALGALRNPMEGVYRGTQVEALWLADKLKDCGEEPRVTLAP
jgi:predicted RNA-binding Zn-ribbon protein involved in translation (DUF1610 family)